ncbi:MAG TPA: GNAT family N-acetyltransferase [Chryseosolibacter sp.]|nr:GNAT family N-acetyltransferase [Chryseosolibacter sp.]
MNEAWILKPFHALTPEELYLILQLRSMVFVVEQNCVFLDIDGKDDKCDHLFLRSGSQIIACSRIFGPGIVYAEPCLSRVVTHPDHRGTGAGKALLQKSMEVMTDMFPGQPIRIGAQLYLKKFYESFGFVKAGDVYLEDGIEHIEMLRQPS